MGTSDSTNTDTTDSSVDIDFSEEQLRLAAQALDEGNDTVEINAEPSDGGSDTNAAVEGEQSPDSQSTDNAEHHAEQNGADEAADNKADESAMDSKPDSDKAEPKESNYAKAKKNAERFDRNWKKLQEQQSELAKQRAELAAREAALAQRANPTVTTQHQQQPNAAQQTGFTPERYEEAADEWEREGEFKMAELARAQAKLLREGRVAPANQAASSLPTQSVQHASQPAPQVNNGPRSPAFIQTWNENLRSLEQDAEFADLRNRESELYKATAAVLQEEARLSYFPDGIRQAARIARLRVEAGAVPELQSKVQAYEQELAKLRAATSPSRGAPNSRGQAKAFEELSLAEQERELMRLAQEVDSA